MPALLGQKRAVSILIAVFVLHSVAAAAETPAAKLSQLRLYSSFWQNLHHFLYVSAWATRPMVPGARRLAMPLPADPGVTLTPAETAAWNATVALYDRTLASQDLLFDLTHVKLELSEADDTLTSVNIAPALRAALLDAAPIYRKHWWNRHDAANRAWIAQVSRQTAAVAPPIITRLTALYGVPWFTTPIRVDVVRAGKSQGAYTSLDPHPHIVVASADAGYDGWAGTEMLFHEASHALIANVRQAIDSAARAANKNPRDLWHVALFFIAGEVTRQQLAALGVDYRPYLYANRLFDLAWPTFRDPIERHVRAFIDGKITLEQMAGELARALP